MSLRRLFDRLYAEAEVAGEASATLQGGAAVRVRVAGRRRQVVLSRQGAPVGAVELITFQGCGRIPDAAEGVCWLPRAGLYRVSYTWEEAPARAALFELAPTTTTTTHGIYTLGYGAGWSPATLADAVAGLSAALWDIRYQPWSKSPQWRGQALAALLGAAYVAVRALGNVNYRGGPVQLADPASAVARARATLAQRPIVLLCGCADAATCHRGVAAAYLAEQLGGVAVAHLAPPAPPPPDPAAATHVHQLLAEGEPLPRGL